MIHGLNQLSDWYRPLKDVVCTVLYSDVMPAPGRRTQVLTSVVRQPGSSELETDGILTSANFTVTNQ